MITAQKKLPIILLVTLLFSAKSFAQNYTLPLWSVIPNHYESDEKENQKEGDMLWVTNVQVPDITVYLPAKKHATGKAVVICPGGGYHGLAYDWEGDDIARWYNSKGIAAIVLKYRLPISKSVINKQEVPLQDAQRAIRLVRHHADEWNIDKNQIGVMGFSAGGHLASTLGTHFDDETKLIKKDAIDLLSARPDFMVLIYPVISMKEEVTHEGSRLALLGENPNQKLVDYYSNELQVKENTPPTFLLHATDDKSVSVENPLLFYRGLRENNIQNCEMHIYPKGGHGFSLAIGQGRLQGWTDRLYEWLLSLKEAE